MKPQSSLSACVAMLLVACSGSEGVGADTGGNGDSAVAADAASNDAPSTAWPELIYDGIGPSPYETMFADWDPDDPYPFLALERKEGLEPAWVHIAVGFAATPEGALERRAGGPNRVRVWRWTGQQPSLVASGTAPTQVSSWDPDNPYPLLVMVEVDPGYWMLYSAEVTADGDVTGLFAGFEQRVYGWPGGGPLLVRDQMSSDWDTPPVLIPEWNVEDPVPIVLMRSEDGATWRVSDTQIEDDGKVKSAPGRTLVWSW